MRFKEATARLTHRIIYILFRKINMLKNGVLFSVAENASWLEKNLTKNMRCLLIEQVMNINMQMGILKIFLAKKKRIFSCFSLKTKNTLCSW